jgi:aminomethyltransferase
MSLLKRTPLYLDHLSLGAKMVDFGGWEMPVQYTGIVKEHRAVRESAGVFDVSHMGEFEVKGPQALMFLEKITANDPGRLGVGRGHYAHLLHANGGTIDDIIVYRIGQDRFLIVVNAGNIDKDWAHVSEVAMAFDGISLTNQSDAYALIALQGPAAERCLATHVDRNLSEIGFFRVRRSSFDGHRVLIARTGYTGEGLNGFEIFAASGDAKAIWSAFMAHPELLPCGLGARDTLRVESSLPLYGHELDDITTPMEAGLGSFLSERNDYIGASVIQAQREHGTLKTLVMLEMIDRGIPRQGYEITDDSGATIGVVTSGTAAPWLGKNIAMGYVKPVHADLGTELRVIIRDRGLACKVVSRPFFKR